MEDDKPNQPRQHPRYGRMEGFVTPGQVKKIPAIGDKLSQTPASSPTIDGMARKSSLSSQKQAASSPSMLNMTIPASISQVNKPAPKPKPSRSLKWYVRRSALALLVIFLVGGAWVGFKFYRNIAKLTHNYNPFAVVASAFNQVKLKSEGDWVNVLLSGYDPSDRDITTDTIMVVSINKKTNQAIMLSVPRDTWVNNLPGFGHQKINASNDISSFNQPGYPKGGMGELEQQIHDKLGITIDYYALVNNAAFKDSVNAVGGIDINIQSPDPRGLYDPNIDAALGGPLRLTNGIHHLNGLQALALVKSRGDSAYSYGFPRGDFDRTAHQRQVMIALKDKVLSTGVLSNPVSIGKLLDAVGNNVQTDVKLNDIQGFYNLMKKISNNNIKSLSLDNINGKQLLTGQNVGGLDAEVPTAGIDNFSQIQASVRSLYSNDPVLQEAANVVVLNGTNTSGLATKQKPILTAKNIFVSSVADAPTSFTATTIVDDSKGKKPSTLKALMAVYGSNVTTADANISSLYPNADFVIIIGADKTSP